MTLLWREGNSVHATAKNLKQSNSPVYTTIVSSCALHVPYNATYLDIGMYLICTVCHENTMLYISAPLQITILENSHNTSVQV